MAPFDFFHLGSFFGLLRFLFVEMSMHSCMARRVLQYQLHYFACFTSRVHLVVTGLILLRDAQNVPP